MRTQIWALGTLVSGAVFLCACATQPSEELGVKEGSLCLPLDTIDSMPDGKDEDCDGKVDEDVDYRTRNCPLGTKIIQGTRGADVIQGTSGADCILGYGGNDQLYGNGGNDTIFGGPGNDKIYTGAGVNTVKAGKGADRVEAAGSSASTLFGEDGPDYLSGSTGSDVMDGGKGNDILVGARGSDVLKGGDCNDLILGDLGIDVAVGGNGVDACECETLSFCEKKGSTRVDCDSNADCVGAGGHCAANVQFCVPTSVASCDECIATAANDVTCDGVDDDCNGQKDEDFVSAATSCGVGACAAAGATSCVAGAVVDSCSAAAPAADDATCDGIDNDCNGAADDGYVCAATTCGAGACAATGSMVCNAGQETDTCTVTCEGACGDAADDDGDNAIDCADSDCASAPECAPAVETDIGKPCTSDSDCSAIGPNARCDTGFPGGYCFTPCDTGNPAGECPAGSFCWLGSACVLPCLAGDTCSTPGFICDGLDAIGLPPDPLCRPSCAVSCPSGTMCDPASNLCF